MRARFNRVCAKNFFCFIKIISMFAKNIFSMVVLTDKHIDDLYQLMSDIFSHEYPCDSASIISNLGFPETFYDRFRRFHNDVLIFNKKIDKKLLDDALSSSIQHNINYSMITFKINENEMKTKFSTPEKIKDAVSAVGFLHDNLLLFSTYYLPSEAKEAFENRRSELVYLLELVHQSLSYYGNAEK